MLHKTCCNFINAVMRANYHDYVSKIWNEFKNVHKSYCKRSPSVQKSL